MLSVITLHTIKQIFDNDLETKLTASEKMFYINCLMYHFEGKPKTLQGSFAFELPMDSFGEWAKFEKTANKLRLAGLVKIKESSVFFVNVWGKYLDLQELPKEEKIFKHSEQFKSGVINEEMKHLLSTKYGTVVTVERLKALATLFCNEQNVVKNTYQNEKEFKKHFIAWCKYNITKTNNEIVKSTGKILGLQYGGD